MRKLIDTPTHNSINEMIKRVKSSNDAYIYGDNEKVGSFEPNTTQFPNELLDVYMPLMTPAEWVVISYLVRKTYGYGKSQMGDSIPLSQILEGTKTSSGYQDLGTRLNKRTVQKALSALENKYRLIEVIRGRSDDGVRKATNAYRLIRKPIEKSEKELVKLLQGFSGG